MHPTEKSSKERYEFDLYISYEHSALIDEWLRPFVARLEQYVGEIQGRDIRVFRDYRVLEPGSMWQAEVTNALSRSRLLLAVVTPRYFNSRWAIAEWKTFEEREKRMNSKMPGLILPVVVVDPGEHAPEWFRRRQFFDMRQAFGFHQETLKMDESVMRLAEAISSALLNAPAFVDAPVVSPEDVDPPPPPPISIPRL